VPVYPSRVSRFAILVGMVVIGCARRSAPRAPPAATPALGLRMISTGSEPRQILRYPVEALDGTVTFTWSGVDEFTDSHSLRDAFITHRERTLHGAIEITSEGHGHLDLVFGTAEPARTGGIWLEGHSDESPDLGIELPTSLRIDRNAHHLALALSTTATRDNYQIQRYADAIAAALPRELPTVPIGLGARWDIVTSADHGTETTTWEIISIAGDEVALTDQPRDTVFVSGAHTQINVRTFAVTANITIAKWESHHNSLTNQTSHQAAVSTLSIVPAHEPSR
jgi:hypothetical protein